MTQAILTNFINSISKTKVNHFNWYNQKHLSPGQTDKHCSLNISNFARQTCLPVWPPRQTLLDKHILLVNAFETFQNIFCLTRAKNVCQAPVCVVAKPTNILLDKQNFKCLPNNIYLFGPGFRRRVFCLYVLYLV